MMHAIHKSHEKNKKEFPFDPKKKKAAKKVLESTFVNFMEGESQMLHQCVIYNLTVREWRSIKGFLGVNILKVKSTSHDMKLKPTARNQSSWFGSVELSQIHRFSRIKCMAKLGINNQDTMANCYEQCYEHKRTNTDLHTNIEWFDAYRLATMHV